LKQKWFDEGNATLKDDEWEGYLNGKENERSKSKAGTDKHTRLTTEID